jgi:hypothetical protein
MDACATHSPHTSQPEECAEYLVNSGYGTLPLRVSRSNIERLPHNMNS